ncbi:hypothetical protein [uncultured Cyclobacterium sp.]|tara:strand:- start:85966 stop:86100 length:135 start_codon:yes stop_codon:yes gene_type:complete
MNRDYNAWAAHWYAIKKVFEEIKYKISFAILGLDGTPSDLQNGC